MTSRLLPGGKEGCGADAIDVLRCAAATEDDDGQPLGAVVGVDPRRPVGPGNPPRQRRGTTSAPRPSRLEIERRVAEAQLWIAQRLPMLQILENTGEKWGVHNTQTVNRYLNLARERMVEELITDRQRHQAEQIFALNECARRAMDAEQFSAAVGAFRVIAEIGGLLRAPIKPPEAK
ncbi:hypothetical protein KBZ18_12265 [Synechococcus sp. Cruz-9H2]|uniref:hypothetical protein n=1 Tax=unclassified Synechococcus TaxID=2626047 RepID=UPI0020CC0767|nr:MULTISPECIES: hypothetical protein [unclassified Synechococcus]MCP9820258.1 hypothetical protein [Synechococcus sp. Cruz-9H2]MCP9844501.1 hypothetical protein [Synechococcus sp. Edmonson 11F2]MCP9856688.1 hypothetical protein [Synechococcus sp. Cruz-9C9]MCP9863974.1 hypothetical protein [Synechococcus sp. Cruz-7E5]MCP9871105.1 hypothetical protein [Synechococcus sp. Cruz-7B9]